MSAVLVINSGSSSLKYALLDPDKPIPLASGLVERIGEEDSRILHTGTVEDAASRSEVARPVSDHRAAFSLVHEALTSAGVLAGSDLVAVGHRVVHGGGRFSEPVLIDDHVEAAIEECIPLAPLHNPANLLGIRAARAAFPTMPQVAVFDTAFHATLPPAAYTYAIDRRVAAEQSLRRYGFHGTSHRYVSRVAATVLGRDPDQVDVITLHLGNGASACAVQAGRSVETSMGMGPLEGLVMGTRSGDLDPTVVLALLKSGMTAHDVDNLLNKRSGMKGLCGVNDLREIAVRAAGGDDAAIVAREVYVHRIRKYIGAYLAVLGGADALVFTAGVGENDAWVREHSCSGLDRLGVVLDPDKNMVLGPRGSVSTISTSDSAVTILVVPTDEEREIAHQTLDVVDEGD